MFVVEVCCLELLLGMEVACTVHGTAVACILKLHLLAVLLFCKMLKTEKQLLCSLYIVYIS